MIDHLQTELALSDDQVEQLRPILEAQREKQREVFADGSFRGDRRAMRERMMEIREETDN